MTASSLKQVFDFEAWKNVMGSVGLIQLIVSSLLLSLVIGLIVLISLQKTREQPELADIPRVISLPNNNWNWFRGGYEAEPVYREKQILPEANIDAELLGILITPAMGTATLKHAGRQETVYKLGDQLGAGIRLVEVEPERVVIEQNGTRKQVKLKKHDSIFESTSVTDNLESQRKEGLMLANMFGAVPVSLEGAEGEHETGFRLNSLSAEMRSLADVEDGDVIVAVSGSAVQELINSPAEWKNFVGQSSLPVTVIRDGQEVTVHVNAASLSQKVLPTLSQN